MTLSAAEALAAEIDHLKQALTAACDDLGAAQEKLARDEGANTDEFPQPEGIGDSMAALAHQLALEVDVTAEAALGQAMDVADQSALRVLGHVETATNELGQAHDTLVALLEAATQRLAQAGQELDTAHREALEHAGGAIGGAFEALRAALDAARSMLDSELDAAGAGFRDMKTALASQILPAFHAVLGDEYPSLIAAAVSESRSTLGAAISGLDEQLGAQAQAFEGLGAQLRTQVCQQLAQCMDETIASLKQQVSERVAVHLTREVMQSVVEAQVGQQLTAAMAPILPEMAAIYKASEAIKVGIGILRDPVGQISDVIKI
jgi:hypothetical protein